MKKNRVKISSAKHLAKNLDQQAVVVLGVERDGTVTVVTYGENKEKGVNDNGG